MDDMNAFDRQLERTILRRVGPSEPVDDAAIFTGVSTDVSAAGRLRSLFTVTRFAVAAGIVVVFGGVLLAGLTTTQQGDDLAPAATISSVIDDASVELRPAPDMDVWDVMDIDAQRFATKAQGEMSLLPSGFSVTGEAFEGAFTDVGDPRLDGTVRYVVNRSNYLEAGEIVSYSVRIDNDGGSWLGSGYGHNRAADRNYVLLDGKAGLGWAIPYVSSFDTTVLRGIDGYDGLTAIIVNVPTPDGIRQRGAVFDGDLPEVPQMPPPG